MSKGIISSVLLRDSLPVIVYFRKEIARYPFSRPKIYLTSEPEARNCHDKELEFRLDIIMKNIRENHIQIS